MHVVSVGRNRERPDVKRGRHSRGHGEPGSEIIAGRLGVGGAKRIVVFDPWDVDRVEERRGQKKNRDQENG